MRAIRLFLGLSVHLAPLALGQCVVVGYLHYHHPVGHEYLDPLASPDDAILTGAASSIAVYRGARIYYFNKGWSWNFVGPWLCIPLGVPYPTRKREIVITLDGKLVAQLSTSDARTFYGLKCNFVPLPMVQNGCSLDAENARPSLNPEQIIDAILEAR